MSQVISPKKELTASVDIPKRFFLKVVQIQSDITVLKMRYDLARESLPYVTALLMMIFTGLVYKEALIGVAPTLLAWVVHSLRKRFDK